MQCKRCVQTKIHHKPRPINREIQSTPLFSRVFSNVPCDLPPNPGLSTTSRPRLRARRGPEKHRPDTVQAKTPQQPGRDTNIFQRQKSLNSNPKVSQDAIEKRQTYPSRWLRERYPREQMRRKEIKGAASNVLLDPYFSSGCTLGQCYTSNNGRY